MVEIVDMKVDKSKKHGTGILNKNIYISICQNTFKLLALIGRLPFLFRKIHLKCGEGEMLEVDDPWLWMRQLKKQVTKSDCYSERGEGGHGGGKTEKIKEEGRSQHWH